MSKAEPRGRDATAADVTSVGACLASAFHEDPLWGHWTFPDASRRAADLGRYMALMADLGPAELWTSMLPSAESITIWTPPGSSYGTPEDQPRIDALFDELLGARAPELHALFEQFEEHCPDGDFWHLEWWATHRDHAGRGLGAALLRQNLARVDAEHLPCYLESTNPANLPRYESFGFRAIDSFAPPAGPTITTMWREPR